jgi:hypothetical protein
VSEIISLLFYRADDIAGKEMVPSEVLKEGKRIHDRLGFNDPQQYRRFVFDPNTNHWWLIIGCADKIDQKDGKVMELKTYWTARMPDRTRDAGATQALIYCWLTGLGKWELWGYSTYSNKLSKIAEGHADDEFVRQTILKAIRLKMMLQDFRFKYIMEAEGGGKDAGADRGVGEEMAG